MSQENVEIVRNQLKAWNRRDKASFVASFRSDAEIDWSRSRAEARHRRSHREALRGTATGIRTPVSGLRIRRPSPLDDSGRTGRF